MWLGVALNLADKSGIDVYLGFQINDDWWKNYTNDDASLNNEAVTGKNLSGGLWIRYKQHSSLKEWYHRFESYNDNFTDKLTREALSQFYADEGKHLGSLIPDKPFAIAPFKDVSEGQTPEEWQAVWTFILGHSQIDIIAVQDGVGHATISDLPAWFSATKDAIAAIKAHTRLWIDDETLNLDNQTMAIQGLVADLKAVQPYVTNFATVYSNHFTSPHQVNPLNYGAYSNYVASNQADTVVPSIPTNLKAKAENAATVQLTWNASTDKASVIGYEICRNSNLVVTLCQHVATCSDTQLDPDAPYGYQIATLDTAGNKPKTSEASSAKTLARMSYHSNKKFVEMGQVIAGAVLTTLPIIVVYLLMQLQFIESMMAGTVKE